MWEKQIQVCESRIVKNNLGYAISTQHGTSYSVAYMGLLQQGAKLSLCTL
jgi:hypothetical protein